MANEEFEIEISPTGKVTIRTIGIKGPRCLDYANWKYPARRLRKTLRALFRPVSK